jgi:hypothetical protein
LERRRLEEQVRPTAEAHMHQHGLPDRRTCADVRPSRNDRRRWSESST